MQDNIKRGKHALFWMKAVLILFAVLLLQMILNIVGAHFLLQSSTSQYFRVLAYLVGFAIMFNFIFTFCVCIAIFVSTVSFAVNYLSWLHRAVSNLRLLTNMSFSPMGAVVLTCIPFVGYFLNYLIFRDMAKSQEKCMQQNQILKERFPIKFLNAWIIASLLLLVIVIVAPSQLGFLTVVSTMLDVDWVLKILEKILVIVICVLYIKSFSAYIKQERELFLFHTETLFQKRVDEAIRERDIERAIAQLRESENKEVPKSENSESDQEK